MIRAGGKEVLHRSLVAGGPALVEREQAQCEKKRRQADQDESAGDRHSQGSSGLVGCVDSAPGLSSAFSHVAVLRVVEFCVRASPRACDRCDRVLPKSDAVIGK